MLNAGDQRDEGTVLICSDADVQRPGELQIDRRTWRAAVMSSLDAISGKVDGGTVGEWAKRIKEIFAFESLTGTFEKLRKRFRQDVEGSKKLLVAVTSDYLPDVTTPTMRQSATSTG